LSKKTFYEKFQEYFEFLKDKKEVDNTSLVDKHKAYLYDERQSCEKFFSKHIELYTYNSFDTELLNGLIKDWYSTLKVINKETNYSKNPYFASSEYLDNIIKSLGIDFPDLLSLYVKPAFSVDIVNLYKIKGTYGSIKSALKYFYLIPVELYEVWLEEDLKLYPQNPNDTDLFFKSYPIRRNELRRTSFDIEFKNEFEYYTKKDPHWYYQKDDILKIIKNPDKNDGLELPSLTPYLKIVAAPDLNAFYRQLTHLTKIIHEEYNYYQANKNDSSFSFDPHRLLYHEQSGKFLSLLETFLGLGYIWTKRYGKFENNEANGNILLSNIDLDLTEYPEDSSIYDYVTRFYEYQKLKDIWVDVHQRPVDKTSEKFTYNYFKEDNQENISDYRKYKKKLLVNTEYENRNDFYFLINSKKDYSATTYGNNIVVSGGIGGDGSVLNKIYFIDKESLTSVISRDIPYYLYNHGCSYIQGYIYLIGGKDNNNQLNTNICKYDLIRHKWFNYNINWKYYNFKTFSINNRFNVLAFGYNSNNQFDKNLYVLDYHNTSCINLTNFRNISFTNFDISHNKHNDVVIYLHEEKKIYKFNLEQLNEYVSSNLDNSDDVNGWLRDGINLPFYFKGNYNYPNIVSIDIPQNIIDLIDNDYKVFIKLLNNGDLVLVNGYNLFRYRNNVWETFKINTTNEFPKIDKCIKLDIIDMQFICIDCYDVDNNQTKYVLNCNFEETLIADNHSNNWAMNLDNNLFTYNDFALFGTYYESIYQPTNKTILEEKRKQFIKYFTRPASTEEYVNHFMDDPYALGEENLEDIDISVDNKEIDSTEKIGQFLEEINPDFKKYLDNLLAQPLEIDFNFGLFNIVSLLDVYVTFFLQEEAYFTQYYLKMDDNISKIINVYKPIHTRYNDVLTLALNIKDPFNTLYINEYEMNKIKNYHSEYFDMSGEIFYNQLRLDINDIPYTPEWHRMYDIDIWRNVRYDLIIKEITNYTIRQILKDLFQKSDNLTFNIKQDLFDNRIVPTQSFQDITRVYFNEKAYVNYFYDNDKPVLDRDDEGFTFDKWIISERVTFGRIKSSEELFDTYNNTQDTLNSDFHLDFKDKFSTRSIGPSEYHDDLLKYDNIDSIRGGYIRYDTVSNLSNNTFSTNDGITVLIKDY
jgi:hypothetical protein